MSITFNESTRIFTLNTAHSTYQMQADMHDYLLHLYYGARTAGEMDYLLSYADRGFSGNPYSAEMDRTYSLDALPQEYPSLGTGDFRNFALNIENADGSQCCDPVYVSHKITKGKYNLSGLPAVRAREMRQKHWKFYWQIQTQIWKSTSFTAYWKKRILLQEV